MLWFCFSVYKLVFQKLAGCYLVFSEYTIFEEISFSYLSFELWDMQMKMYGTWGLNAWKALVFFL